MRPGGVNSLPAGNFKPLSSGICPAATLQPRLHSSARQRRRLTTTFSGSFDHLQIRNDKGVIAHGLDRFVEQVLDTAHPDIRADVNEIVSAIGHLSTASSNMGK